MTSKRNDVIDEARALNHLMDLLRVPGLSRQERKVARAVSRKLRDAGCKAGWISYDDARLRVEGELEVGNLIVQLPGTVPGPRLLFIGHLDTVPLCRGAVPVRRGNRIVSAGNTGLGADNRTAVACLVTLAETLLSGDIPHPPITLLFAVAEEIGLHGSKAVRKSDLGNPKMGFNIDSGPPADYITAALGAYRWTADIQGISSHAGVHPEDGISAILIAARAIRDIGHSGYFGKVQKGRNRGTSNVGMIEGGEASNQVTDKVRVTGECRSHDPEFLEAILKVYRDAFEHAAASVKNSASKAGRVKFKAHKDYDAFALDRQDPVVKYAIQVAKKIGMKPTCRDVNGGLDANALNRKGIPTITFGAGQHSPHTVEEHVDIQEYLDGCRLAVELARSTGVRSV